MNNSSQQPVGYERVFGFMVDRYGSEVLAKQMTLLVYANVKDMSWTEVAEMLIVDGSMTQIEVDQLFNLLFQGGK